MKFYGLNPSDMDGIVAQLRNTIGVEVAVFIYETDFQTFKVSLRSKEYVDVSEIAMAFGGGGHRRAAGCTMQGTPYDVVNNISLHVEKQLKEGQNVVFDVDVVGGCNIKKFYGDRALSVFIQPPSVDELRCRLEGRGTDAPEVIESRIAKAEYELSFAPQFDCVIVNDDLETAKAEALKVIKKFLEA